MKTTMKILPLLFGVMLFFTQCEKDVIEKNTAEAKMEIKAGHCSVTQTLWAGAGQNDLDNGTPVGNVTATLLTGNQLLVEYEITNLGYSLTEVHLWVGLDKSVGVFPRQAAPGRFPHKATLDFGTTYWFTTVDLDTDFDPSEDIIYVSAHGVVVGIDGVEGLEALLPKLDAGFRITANSTTSYHNLFLSDADYFDGTYDSYCIDPTKSIDALTTPYPTSLYSSFSAPVNLVPYPNYNEVNWVINNISVDETYNYADIQMAIWELLFGPPDPFGEAPYNWINSTLITAVKLAANSDNVYDIVTAAEENSDFVPGCDDYLVILLVPVDTDVQPHLIWKKIPCPDYGSETVWAYGEHQFDDPDNFIARKWGWIFEVDCTDDEDDDQ